MKLALIESRMWLMLGLGISFTVLAITISLFFNEIVSCEEDTTATGICTGVEPGIYFIFFWHVAVLVALLLAIYFYIEQWQKETGVDPDFVIPELIIVF